MSAIYSKIGWVCLATAFALTALSYYLMWQSGCVFDSKQGFGDMQSAQRLSLWSYTLSIFALPTLAAGVALIWRKTWAAFFGTLLFVVILGAPLLIMLFLTAELSGVKACVP